MKKIVPDPPASPLNVAASDDLLLDRAAADRALNHYLLTPPPTPQAVAATYVICDSVSLETSLLETSSLLRCASASASELANGLSGQYRDVALSIMHLVDLGRAYADKSLDNLTTH